MKKKKLFLLDVFPLLYRAHFAMIKQPLRTSSGRNTSAVLGFCNYLFQILFKEKPDYIGAAFDSVSLERKAALKTYKGKREKMPEDIIAGKEYVEKIIKALNIKTVHAKGFEADDVIGTITKKALDKGFETYIVSPDKDFAQLVQPGVFLYRPSYRGANFEILDEDGVEGKFGVSPERIVDLLALKGDATDNIPGVPKIGEKTALNLLSTYGTVEELLEHKEEISKASIRESLIHNEESARLSYNLATIKTHLIIPFIEEEFKLKAPETPSLVKLLDELELFRLKERIFSNTFYKNILDEGSPQKKRSGLKEECEIYSEDPESLNEFLETGSTFYFIHTIHRNGFDLVFIKKDQVSKIRISNKNIPELLKTILRAETINKVTYDVKPFLKWTTENNITIRGDIHDVKVAHYVLSPEASHQLERILGKELGTSFSNLNASGNEKVCTEVMALPKLNEFLFEQLKANEQEDLYQKIDLPLVQVLTRMETFGIKIDQNALSEISSTLRKEIEKVENKIYDLAGEKINLRSSRQTSELFEKLFKDVKVKRTRTGQISTAESYLMDYAADNEIAENLLRFRKLSKLLSTYTESLPNYINPATGRIHADFLQTSTATGRLSCINPNLQNLPIQMEEGREVRKAVIPENEDYVLLAADYSQIELRLLAALSKDKELINAFSKREDVHTITAAKVFNVDESAVTSDMRSKAKMVNYGIAYGLSNFGLSQRLKISLKEAKEIIDQYFLKFSGIKSYIDECIQNARKNGYTLTATGRRRYLQDINSANGTERKAAERIAINAPLQGLAADLIKLSMIEVDEYTRKENLKSKMILQVHDELVFEIYKPELPKFGKAIKQIMENAIKFTVPIEVNIGVGVNWLQLEDYLVE